MHVSEELIRDFFAHRCTPEEASEVSDYLNANPGALEKYLPVADWESADVHSLLPEAFWNKQWERIRPRKNRNKVVVIMRRVAVAAVLLLAIGVSVFYLAQKSAQQTEPVAELQADFKTITNDNGNVQTVSLPDGSVAKLSPRASLTFKEGFEKNSRDIVLNGEALFSVVKDSSRPFTVYSGNISTTALGTIFKVVHWGNGTETQVHLYEGKVLVRSEHATNKKESYLAPGDLLSYSDNIINVIREGKEIVAGARKGESKPGTVDAGTESSANVKSPVRTERENVIIPKWYRFEKESVANVFDQLAALYDVKIDYDAEALKHKYFIGKFEQNNTIDNILKTIAELNHLQVEKAGESHYKIK